MKILITGSSGKVGSAVARKVSKHFEVIGLDLHPGRFTQIQGDVCDRKLIQTAMSEVNAVIHIAALHAPHVGGMSDSDFKRINVEATKHLLEVAIQNNCDHFVLTSTTSIYGNSLIPADQAVWVTEDLLPKPRDIYDETKLMAEMACEKAARLGLRTTSIRMSRCFPEPANLMAIYRLYRGVDERDVADAHYLALLRVSKEFQVYNISGPTPFKQSDTRDLLTNASDVILKYYPQSKSIFEENGWDFPTTIDRVYVSEKAKTELGYQPKFDFAYLLKN